MREDGDAECTNAMDELERERLEDKLDEAEYQKICEAENERVRKYTEQIAAVSADECGSRIKSQSVLVNRKEDCIHTHVTRMREFFHPMPRYASCNFDNYEVANSGQGEAVKKLRDYSANIRENIANGKSILLAGNMGTGKDHLLMSVSKAAFDAGCWVVRATGATLRQEAMDAISQNAIGDLIRDLTSKEALWLSDPSIPHGATPFYADLLYQIIERMYVRQRPVWVSVNAMSKEKLADAIGSTVTDRIRDRSLTILCDWKSYRKPID